MNHRRNTVSVLGVYVADLSFRISQMPTTGETRLASGFTLGPGGKGSNQAVAAARLGAATTFITRLGNDEFARLGFNIWREAGVVPHVFQAESEYTGAAGIFIDNASGDNAIVIAPGAASSLDATSIDAAADVIAASSVFVTQLEQPIDAARRGLQIARQHGVTTILNPAPAATLDDELFTLCDFMTPNETEIQSLTNIEVSDLAQARAAADVLLNKGVGTVVVTLGESGALIHNQHQSTHIKAFSAGKVVETTGAGDAFNAGFAVGIARDMTILEAANLASATAAICVTRTGTAHSMPTFEEVTALLTRRAEQSAQSE